MDILNLEASVMEYFANLAKGLEQILSALSRLPKIKHKFVKFVKSLGKIPKIHLKKVHFRPFVPIRFNRKREMFLIEEIVPP